MGVMTRSRERTARLVVLAALPLLLAPAHAPAGDDGPRSRTFALKYAATVERIPDGARSVDLWLPLPQTDRNQTVHRVSIEAPGGVSIGREARFGNHALHARVERPRGPVAVALTIEATRFENVGSREAPGDLERARDLAAEPLVPLDGPIRALALDATRGLGTDLEKARALYDKVVDTMTYDKTGTGWGRGDALFACDARRGNCTDFHALLIGMARSVGLPARFAVGLSLPRPRGSGEVAGYHCWAELHVEGRGWVPVDASEAAKHPDRRGYFFGHHDEDRLELSRGRHLALVPAQHGPPLNFFVDPYAEVDGKPHAAVARKVSFVDRDRPSPGH